MQMNTADEAEALEPREDAAPGETGGEAKAPAEDEIVAGDDEAGEAGVAVKESEESGEAPVDELGQWKEMAVRATAELDNFRKRMVREKADALRYANQSLLEELLPVLDNFEMGLQAASQEEDSMIFQGMQMVKNQLDAFLSAQGAVEVESEGAVFDPNIHEAVAQEESDEVEEGTVLRVIRRGYRINDRLLRPANVVVAKAATGSEEGE